jgi:tetratricopeptide (TPR) repeat protein
MLLLVTLVSTLAFSSGSPQAAAAVVERQEAIREYQVGQQMLAAEQWEKAAAAFQAAVKHDALFTDAHYGLGRAFMGLERYASAIKAYEDCIEAARAMFSLRERDRVGADQRVVDQVRALREAVITIRKQQTGQIENQVLQIESRIRELERSRTGLTGVFEPPPQVLLALGSAHFRNGNTIESRSNWEAAVRGNPRLGEGWNNLAVSYMRAGRKTDAERAVKNAEAAGFRVNQRLKDDIAAMKP